MNRQPSVQPFDRQMPMMPMETVPTTGSPRAVIARESKLAANPLPRSRRNLHNGRIFYGYYCLMCHGEKGDGNGQVGQSYVPKPTDLTSANVKSLPDGQLYAKMLSGTGHEPVMDNTVPPDQRWQIVMYVRSLKASP